jgi:hypothetical protein
MRSCHHELKELDKRITVEGTKCKNLATSLEKSKKAIELEKRTYSTEFKRGFEAYAENPHFPPEMKNILAEYAASLDKI